MTFRASIRNRVLPAFARTLTLPESGDANRLLILQPDHLGDIILVEPAVRLIRHCRPDAYLIAVVGPWSAEIARLAWPVDEIVTLDFPGFKRDTGRSKPLAPYMQIERDARTLRLLNASDAIVLRDDAWWAAALARAAVPGLVVTAVDERNRPFATTLVDLQSHTHNTARAAALATALFAEELSIGDLVNWDMSPRISVEEQSAEEARALLRELGIDGRYIVIHPGAGSPVKTWPVRFWRAVIGSLDGHRIVVTGSQAEALDCAAIAAGFASTVSIAGQTSLETLLGLLHGSSLAVGTDNGPLHLAAAAGTPTIRLFGPSDPRRYGPPAGSSIHKIIEAGWSCPRCGDLSLTRAAGCGCMLAITPTAVVNSIRKALSDGP